MSNILTCGHSKDAARLDVLGEGWWGKTTSFGCVVASSLDDNNKGAAVVACQPKVQKAHGNVG